MARIPEVIPVTDLRQDAAAVLRRVRGRKQPLIITQRGRAAAVMLSVDAYERGEHERQILLLLARGEQEIAAGKGHELESVFAEADALLREEEP
jgi:prevent-host-death family protein